MEGHAENAHVGRGEGVDWIVKESFETEAEMKAIAPRIFLREATLIITLANALRT